MNNLMQNFMYQGYDVEVIVLDNTPYFNAKQVGECLEIGASAVRNHIMVMTDKQKLKITNKMIENSNVRLNGFRKLHNTGETFLTEAGVYKLVFKSKKPEAEKFMDWIAEEVLPSIRKNGGYIATTEQDDESTIMAKALMIAQATIEKNKKRINELSSENQKLIIENNHKQDIIETFSDYISLAEKRQRIAQIVNYKPAEDSSEYKDRWNLLYSEFEKKYHMNLNLRVKRTISKHKLKRLSKMDYIDRYLDMIPELYDLTIVLFETSYDYIIDKFNM